MMTREEQEQMLAKMHFIGTDNPEEIEHEKDKLRFLWSLTDEQKAYLCDAGVYNDTIGGYLIAACKIARTLEPDSPEDAVKLTDEQIRTLLQGLRWALSEKDKEQADKLYREF